MQTPTRLRDVYLWWRELHRDASLAGIRLELTQSQLAGRDYATHAARAQAAIEAAQAASAQGATP